MIEERKPNFRLSIEVQQLVKHLSGFEVGDEITYEELNQIADTDVRQGALTSARRILQRDNRIVFGTITGVGIVRLDNGGIVEAGTSKLKRVRNTARNTIKTISCVDYEKLNNEDKVKHNTTASIAGAIIGATSTKAQRAITQKVMQTQETLPVQDTLEAFKNT